MIADALRTSIEQYARARSQNPVYALAEAGTLSATTVARYIANVHYIIQHTLIHLARARDVARARGDERLAMHYQKKLDEEQGHDAWSQRDLDSLARLVAQKRVGVAVTSAMRKVAANNSAIIEEDPALYLVYAAYAEYLVVLLGGDWLVLLEERCGIPRTSMTVIGNHVELDRDHADEAFAKIDMLVDDPRKLPRMRRVLADSLALFDEFCMELTEEDRARQHSPDVQIVTTAA